MIQSKLKCRVIDCGNGMFGVEIENEKTTLKVYKYITSRHDRILHLADAINRGEVSPLHIEDIIDDFLE